MNESDLLGRYSALNEFISDVIINIEAELEEKCKRLAELNAELNMDKRENEIVDGAEEQSEDERDENNRTRSDRTDR